MASKEVYSLKIGIKVDGDKKAKASLKDLSSVTEKTEKKLKTLDKTTVSPTAKIRDEASSTLDKIKSKTDKINKTKSKTKISADDQASSVVDKVQKKADKLGKTESKAKLKVVDNASSVLEKADGKLKGWLKAGTKKIISIGVAGSLALGGIGVSTAIKTFTDFEYGMKTVQATAQASDSELQTLTNTAKHLGATTSFSAVESAEAMNYLAMAGYKTNDIVLAMPGLLNAAAASGENLASVSDIISDGITAFGLKASDTSHFADVMAQASANANTNIGMLGESFKYVGSLAGTMGYSVEDTSIALGLMANAGVKAGQGGTTLKNAIANMAAPTDTMATVMEKYNLSLTDSKGKMKSLKSVMDMLRKNLGGLGEAEQSAAASHLFGKEAMAGMLSVINASEADYNKLTSAIYSADGAAQKMADTKLDSLSGQWTILKSAVEGMNISLGEKLAPYAKQFVSWLTNKIPTIENKIVSIVDYISNHTGQIKAMASAFLGIVGGFTALTAVGSVASSLNNVTKFFSAIKAIKTGGELAKTASGLTKICSLGKLLPAIMSPAGLAITAAVATTAYAVHSYHKLMNESVTTASEDLSVGEKIINKLTGSTIKSKAELKAVGLVYDDFGEGVSESFQNAAKDASKSLLEIEMNLNRLNLADKFDTSAFKNYVNDFTYEGINEIRNRKSEVQSELQKAFSYNGNISDSESETMDIMSDYYQTGINKELEIRNEIYEIGSKAIEDHGKLLDSDMEQIKSKLAELNALKLQYANAENEKEQKYASEKFARDAEKVSGINEASSLIKNRAKTYNKNTEDIYKTYSDALYDMNTAMENTTDKSQKTQLQKQITETTKERDKALQKAHQEYQSDLNTLYRAYPEAKGKLNEKTGEAFTKKDLNLQGEKANIMANHSALNGITKSGVYAIQNDQTKALETMSVVVNETTGKIEAVMNQTDGKIGAYSEKEKESLTKVAEKCSKASEAMTQLSCTQASVDTATGKITNRFGDVVGKLQEVKTASDKTKTGMLNINGTEIKVTCDLNGAITNMSDFNGEIKNTPNSKNVDVTTNTDSAAQRIDQVTGAINNMPDSKTITITTVMQQIMKGVTGVIAGKGVTEVITGIGRSVLQDAASKVKNGYASGTDSATAGIHEVAEHGVELVVGRQTRKFKGGEQVLNNEETKSLFKGLGKSQVYQPQQQVQVVGAGGNTFGDINLNVNNGQDPEQIIQQACQEFARQLREALFNTK